MCKLPKNVRKIDLHNPAWRKVMSQNLIDLKRRLADNATHNRPQIEKCVKDLTELLAD
jgi:uncharacterized protein YihD (DUF1040 family)